MKYTKVIHRRSTALLLALFVLAACGDPPAPKVTLTGVIRDAYTNTPIEGAQIVVGTQPGMATDAQGAWGTQAWSATDQVVVIATGYQSATLPLTDRTDLAKPKTLTVTLDMTVRPNTLAGVITDVYTGKPLAGATVDVVDANPAMRTTTDSNGRYTFDNVPEAFQIAVAAPGHKEQRADIRRSIAQDLTLRANTLAGSVTNLYSKEPIADVTVQLGDAIATTDDKGRYELQNVPPTGELVFTRPDFDSVTQAFTETTALDAVLRPNVVRGVVTDSATGQPLSRTLLLGAETLTSTAVITAYTDDEGAFALSNVPEGTFIKALLPGYLRAESQVKAGALTADLKLEPFMSKALYMKSIVAASKKNVNDYFDIIDQTELNTVILDLKSDNLVDLGLIFYDSQIPLVKELGTSADIMDLPWILAEAKRRNIYTIARIHVFSHDNELIKVKPEWYVQKDGKPWFADFGVAWLDTYNQEVWDYNIAIGVEAIQMGFDEINFDYIRFPSDGDLTGTKFLGPRDWRNNPDDLYNTVGAFLQRAQVAVNGVGGYTGGDVFGYVAWKPQPTIGQNLQVMGKYLDYVYPMVYPSHFWKNELGFDNAHQHPYEIVAESMKLIKNQLVGDASRAKVRPWLQDFTLIWVEPIIRYGPKEVRAQIDAAEDNGTNGWALWDSDNDYEIDALKPGD